MIFVGRFFIEFFDETKDKRFYCPFKYGVTFADRLNFDF